MHALVFIIRHSRVITPLPTFARLGVVTAQVAAPPPTARQKKKPSETMAAHLGSAWIPCSRNSSVATLVASRRINGCRPSRPRRRKLTVDVSEGSAPLPQLHQMADLGHKYVLLLA